MEFNFNLEKELDFSVQEPLIKGKIHIRVHQRNGRKCITTVEGLDEDLDVKRICKALRKHFNCNGNVIVGEDGEVMQLQGDQHDACKRWFLEQEIIPKT